MGGDSTVPLSTSSTEEVPSLWQDFPLEEMRALFGIRSGNDDDEGLDAKSNLEKVDDHSVINGGTGLKLREYPEMGPMISPVSEAAERQRLKVYGDVLRTYEELPSRVGRLEEAKNKILSYIPGSWVERAGGMSSSAYDVPKTTTLLLIGPKGSGKSSLVNKISRVFEDNLFVSGRAQVSHYSSNAAGTLFLNEYMIPRGSGSFCLYDTRSLSDDLSENLEMLKHWMTKGVRHGELIKRKSDSNGLKTRLNCKGRRSCSPSQVRPINFVIFVLNGLSVLEAMDDMTNEEKKQQSPEMIATIFNDHLLSFKDDKPVVVITHGDLLSISDRVRVRVYLGELLGIPPTQQIFDIPENRDAETALTIVDLIFHCLERADRNFPVKYLRVEEERQLKNWLSLVLVFLAIVLVLLPARGFPVGQPRAPASPSSQMKVEWHKIRHLWLG